MKKILIVIFLFYAHPCFSQMILHDPVSARIFNTQLYSDIKGTPFLFDKWMKGDVVTEKGTYQNLDLKIDVYANKLYFNKEGEAFEIQDHIKRFTIKPSALDSTTFLYFTKDIFTDGVNSNRYIQILALGKINLYKKSTKLLTELNEMNTGIIKSFSNVNKYYVSKETRLQEVRLNKKEELLNMMQDNYRSIQIFIKEHKLSINKEDDLIKIISYYNSL